MFINEIKNENILNSRRYPSLPSPLPPNQSLKLTEPAVDDFAARRWTDLAPMIGTSAQRTAWRRLFAAAA